MGLLKKLPFLRTKETSFPSPSPTSSLKSPSHAAAAASVINSSPAASKVSSPRSLLTSLESSSTAAATMVKNSSHIPAESSSPSLLVKSVSFYAEPQVMSPSNAVNVVGEVSPSSTEKRMHDLPSGELSEIQPASHDDVYTTSRPALISKGKENHQFSTSSNVSQESLMMESKLTKFPAISVGSPRTEDAAVGHLSSLESPVSVLDGHKLCPEYRELANAFRIMDLNGDGHISGIELRSVLSLLGVHSSEEEIDLIMQAVDTDGDGQIDLEEFVFHNTIRPEGRAQTTELRAAFHVFDIDKNDFISVQELHQVLKGLGEPTTMEDCVRMIRGVDSDGDGQVDFEEFKRMMTGSNGLG